MRLATERQRLLIICKRKHVAFQFRVFALLHIRLNGKREGTNGGKWKIRNNSFALYVKGQLDKHDCLLHLPGNAEIPPQRPLMLAYGVACKKRGESRFARFCSPSTPVLCPHKKLTQSFATGKFCDEEYGTTNIALFRKFEIIGFQAFERNNPVCPLISRL